MRDRPYHGGTASYRRLPEAAEGSRRDGRRSPGHSRIGPDCRRKKAGVDTGGFAAARSIPPPRGTVEPAGVPGLRSRFPHRIARTGDREGRHEPAHEARCPSLVVAR